MSMRVDAKPGSSPLGYAARGVIAVLFGAGMLLMPGLGLATFVLVYGLFLLLDGGIALIGSFTGLRGRGFDWGLLLSGLAGLVLGFFFLFRPGLSIGILSVVVAAWFIATGLGTFLSAIEYRKQVRGGWLLIVAGIVAILFGIYLLVRPILAVTLLPFFLGGYALIWGLLLLGAAFGLWRQREPATA